MMHALVKKPTEYNIVINGRTDGLYHNYGYDEHMFCLMSRCCPVFFVWEDLFEDQPEGDRLVKLNSDMELAYSLTMQQEIMGRGIRELMENTTPREWAEFVKVTKPKHLHILEMFTNTDPVEALRVTALTRALQHEKFYRGRLSDNKTGLIKIATRSRLTPEEDKYLEDIKAQFKNLYLINMGLSK